MKSSVTVVSCHLFALACTLWCSTAHAAPATYTIRGLGTGSLGNVGFTSTPFAITAEVDTDGVAAFAFGSSNGFSVTNEKTTVFVDGIGSGEFTSTIRTTSNHAFSRGGFGDFGPSSSFAIAFVDNSAFGTHDLLSSFGPITGPVTVVNGPGRPSSTTGGDFYLTFVENGEFLAKVVPEPATFSLNATALALVLLRRAKPIQTVVR